MGKGLIVGAHLFNSPRTATTEAGAREWIGAFLQGMLDAGFVQTSDTGQINPLTVPITPTAVSTGYAMFRFDDALQATHPIYVKVEFQTSTHNISGVEACAMFITVGRGSNGSGTITGVLLARTGVGATATPATTHGSVTTNYTHAASCGDGYMIFMPFVNDTRIGTASSSEPKQSSGFLIERSRDMAGNPTGDAVLVVIQKGSTASSFTPQSTTGSETVVTAINYASGAYNTGASPATCLGGVNGTTLGPTTSLASGSIGPVFPWDVVAPAVAPWRSCVIVSIPGGDMPGGPFTTSLCSRPSLMYPIPFSVSHSRWGIAFNGDTISRFFGIGIRWED